MKDIGFWVDVQNKILIVNDRAQIITKRQADLLWLLRKRYPHFVDNDTIINQVWGRAGCEPNVLSVFVMQCRRLLRDYSWSIVNSYGSGYRLQNKAK